MRIGILADIHSHLPHLEACLAQLTARRCDTIIQLGDIINAGDNPTPVIERLIDAGVSDGVWGNHDFGLMHEPPTDLLERYPTPVRSFLQRQRATLRLSPGSDSIFASHIDANLDPYAIEDLWSRRPVPKQPGDLEAIFMCRPETYILAGHHHRWFAATPAGPVSYQRRMTLPLGTERWFLVIDAVKNGWAAILDSDRRILERVRVR